MSEKKSQAFKTFLDTAQGVLACLAVLAAGWWFFQSDEAGPKATCSQKLNMVQVTSDHTKVWWCSLELRVENIGQIPFKISTARIFVECIQPQFTNTLQSGRDGRFYWGPNVFDNNGTNYAVSAKILPGEVQYLNFEFIMPTNIQIFRIFSLANDPELSRIRHGWDSACIYEMQSNHPVDISSSQN